MIDVTCLECGKPFKSYKSRIKAGRGKFCSKSCFYKDFSTRPPWNKGKKLSKIHRMKTVKNLIHKPGKGHPRWKGNDVGYDALHDWIKRYLGFPTTCEHCKKSFPLSWRIHWANKDHKYKRNKKDWIRLCLWCHKKYDKKW